MGARLIRVALADDHRLFLDGLAEGLEAVPDLTVVATAGDGASLLDELRGSDPDVLLVDLEMPGLDGLQVLRALPKPLPTIVVTMYAGEEQRRDAKAAGAAGFLSKSTALPEVAAAIRAVAAGLRLIDASPP
ncbi:MAG TPA: response regulator transcription factor, partial [Acidimicrobiia bacterium]